MTDQELVICGKPKVSFYGDCNVRLNTFNCVPCEFIWVAETLPIPCFCPKCGVKYNKVTDDSVNHVN